MMTDQPNGGNGTASVSLMIPCRAEYVGVARLAILGVASRMNFSYDEVEDLRLAVGEACTGAIDRAERAEVHNTSIQIVCHIQDSVLMVDVRDSVPTHRGNAASEAPESGGPEDLGGLLMGILVDEVNVDSDPDTGTTVRLKKKVQVHDQSSV